MARGSPGKDVETRQREWRLAGGGGEEQMTFGEQEKFSELEGSF